MLGPVPFRPDSARSRASTWPAWPGAGSRAADAEGDPNELRSAGAVAVVPPRHLPRSARGEILDALSVQLGSRPMSASRIGPTVGRSRTRMEVSSARQRRTCAYARLARLTEGLTAGRLPHPEPSGSQRQLRGRHSLARRRIGPLLAGQRRAGPSLARSKPVRERSVRGRLGY